MGFVPISLDKYVSIHLKSNHSDSEIELRQGLKRALSDYHSGVKCSCGNDIWVIGSAIVGNSCFSCITGESTPNEDYEIDSAIKKNDNKKGRRHIDEIDKRKIAGFFDDDGYEINMDLIQKPNLCITCQNNDLPNEEILCNLTRHDQKDDNDFICFAYIKK